MTHVGHAAADGGHHGGLVARGSHDLAAGVDDAMEVARLDGLDLHAGSACLLGLEYYLVAVVLVCMAVTLMAGLFGLVVVTSFFVGMGVMAAGCYTCCHRQQG